MFVRVHPCPSVALAVRWEITRHTTNARSNLAHKPAVLWSRKRQRLRRFELYLGTVLDVLNGRG
jgi:hypothetical protein